MRVEETDDERSRRKGEGGESARGASAGRVGRATRASFGHQLPLEPCDLEHGGKPRRSRLRADGPLRCDAPCSWSGSSPGERSVACGPSPRRQTPGVLGPDPRARATPVARRRGRLKERRAPRVAWTVVRPPEPLEVALAVPPGGRPEAPRPAVERRAAIRRAVTVVHQARVLAAAGMRATQSVARPPGPGRHACSCQTAGPPAPLGIVAYPIPSTFPLELAR